MGGEHEAQVTLERKSTNSKNNAFLHTIVPAFLAFKYEHGYPVGYFISHDSRMFFKDITRSHGYSLITYSDLNQQQIDLCYNCTVNLTGNTVNRTPLLLVAVHLFPNMPPWLSSLLFNPFTPA